jgi:VCBS repeat-containing protein
LSLSDNRYEPAFTSGTLNLSNTAPVAVNDAYSVNEDEVLNVAAPGVLGNDSDPDGQTLSAVLVSDVSNGTLNLNADGSFSYVPDLNFNGSESFSYAAYDGFDSVSALVSISVNSANDAPLAVDDAYSVNEDEVLNVAAPGVLGNDSDAEGDALIASLVNSPSSGTLTFNPDGSFSYTPTANFNGTVSFTYQALDGLALSNVATVTITVLPVNDPPVCSVVLNMPSLWPANNRFRLVTLSGCTDPEGDPVTITIVSVFQDEPVGPQPDAIIHGSSVDLRAERAGNGDGRVYHITYAASDGQGGTSTGEVLIGVVPHDQSGNLEPIDGGALYDSTIAQ